MPLQRPSSGLMGWNRCWEKIETNYFSEVNLAGICNRTMKSNLIWVNEGMKISTKYIYYNNNIPTKNICCTQIISLNKTYHFVQTKGTFYIIACMYTRIFLETWLSRESQSTRSLKNYCMLFNHIRFMISL